MGAKFGTWNVRNFCMSASLKTVASELAEYKLRLMGVPEVRWDKDGSHQAEGQAFLCTWESHQQARGSSLISHST
jgi:hypothetical protein